MGEYVVGAEGVFEQRRLLLGEPELLPRACAGAVVVTAAVAGTRTAVRRLAIVVGSDLQPLSCTFLRLLARGRHGSFFLDTLREQHQVELHRWSAPLHQIAAAAAAYPQAKP